MLDTATSTPRRLGRWVAVTIVSVVSAGLVVAPTGSDLDADQQPTAGWTDSRPTPSQSPTPAEPAPLRVWAHPKLPDDVVDAIVALPAVTAVVESQRGVVPLHAAWDADGTEVTNLLTGLVIPVQAVAVDPNTPGLSADLASLPSGAAALSAASAALRGIGVGGQVDVGGNVLEVVAVVSDDLAGSAELIVSVDDGALLGLGRRALTVQHAGNADLLEAAIEALSTDDVDVRARQLHGDRRSLTRGLIDMKERFGEFAHGPVRPDGRFQQDRDWIDANIVKATIPIIGTVSCHREFVPIVIGALEEVVDAGLAHLIDPSDYGGCWAARRIAGSDSISKHAFGAAIDLNVSTNRYGDEPTIDPRIVVIFERWGMRWGGNFGTPDGMHFEWHHEPGE